MTEGEPTKVRTKLDALLALVALASLLGGAEWIRVFGSSTTLLRIFVAAIVPALIVGIVGRSRSLAVTGPVSLVAMGWFLAVAVLHDSVAVVIPAPTALGGIYHGLIDGWSGILSLPLTVSGPSSLLVFPLAMVWVSSMVGCEVVRRTRFALAGLVPAVVSFVTALFFGIGGRGNRIGLTLVLAAVVLAFAALTARPLVDSVAATRHAGIGRRVTEILAVGVVALLVALACGGSVPVVASGHPYNPRPAHIPPTQPLQPINPLDQLKAWALDPTQNVLTVRPSSGAGPWRLAVLPDWNPVDGWTTSSVFYRISNQVPDAAQGPGTVDTGEHPVTQDIRIDKLAGPWLPAQEMPVSIGGIAALAQPGTGSLVAASGSATGANYTVVSAARDVAPAVTNASYGTAPLVQDIPPQFQKLALKIVGSADTAWAKVQALRNCLGGMVTSPDCPTLVVDPSAPSGTNIRVMNAFLIGVNGDSFQHHGTSEQFAAAFALLAQSLGLPTRVVVNLVAHTAAVAGTYQLTTGDALAEDEVEFAGVGWVLVDPNPHGDTTTAAPLDETIKGSTTISGSHPGPPTGPAKPARTQVAAPPASSGIGGTLMLVAIIICGFGALLGLVVLVVRSVRTRRARRRRSATGASQRVLGAWLESLDLLRDLGTSIPPSDTASELASVGAARLGEPARADFRPLADLTNATLFSNWEPDDDAALVAWGHVDAVARTVDEQLGRKGRLLRAFDLRVLFRRRS